MTPVLPSNGEVLTALSRPLRPQPVPTWQWPFRSWWGAPRPRHAALPRDGADLEALCRALEERRMPLQALQLRWMAAEARAAAAAWTRYREEADAEAERGRERREARHLEVEAELARRRDKAAAMEPALHRQESELVRLAAECGVPVDPTAADPPRDLEESLNEAEERARRRIEAVRARRAWRRPAVLAVVKRPHLLDVAGPICSGILVGFNLAALLGWVSTADLYRGHWETFAALGGLGCVVVALLGRVVSAAARESGSRWLLAAAAVILVAAEVTVDAYGLRQWHLNAILASAGLVSQREQLLPLFVYFLIGTLMSGPYVGYKIAAASAPPEPVALPDAGPPEEPEPIPAGWSPDAEKVARARTAAGEVKLARARWKEAEARVREQAGDRVDRSVEITYGFAAAMRLDQLMAEAVRQHQRLDVQVRLLVARLEPLPPRWWVWLRRMLGRD